MRVAFLLCLLFVTGAVCEYWSGTKALLQTMAKEKHLQQHQLAKALQQLKPGEKNDKLPSPEELPQLLEEYQKDFLQIYNELDLIYPELAVMLDAPIHANGKEIDRAKMGVMLFLWTVVGDSGAFMSFTEKEFLDFRTNVVTKLTNLARLVPDRHLDAQFKGKQHDPIVDIAGVAIDCRAVHVVALEIAINDLGKSKEFSKQVNIMLKENKVVKFSIIDHDLILRKALEWYNGNTKPASHLTESEKYIKNVLDQTYGQVPRVFKDIMAKGLASDFNPAQFLQGECLPGNLAVLKQFLAGSGAASTATVMDVFLLHSLFDLLGGGGLKTVPGLQVNLWGYTLPGKLVVGTWLRAFDDLIQNLPSADPLKVYQDGATKALEGNFVEIGPEGQLLEPGLNARYTWSLQRVLLLTRANQCQNQPCEVATTVVKAFKKYISNEKSLLAEYLAETGYHGQRGFLLYYAPQLFANIKDNINALTLPQKVELYLHTLEQLYRKIDTKLQTARILYTPPSKVISVNINAVAAAVGPEYKNAAFDASVLDTRHFEIRGSGNEYILCNPKKATAGC